MDKNKTNQGDGREDVGLSGPDMEETMGETPKVSLHDLLLCLGPLSSSGEGNYQFQLNPSGSLLDGPVLSERHLGSPSISSSQQVSNPFFLPGLQQAGHFGINESSPFSIPPHLLSTSNVFISNPLLEVVRLATHINRSGKVPFLVLYDGFSDHPSHRRGTSLEHH